MWSSQSLKLNNGLISVVRHEVCIKSMCAFVFVKENKELFAYAFLKDMDEGQIVFPQCKCVCIIGTIQGYWFVCEVLH